MWSERAWKCAFFALFSIIPQIFPATVCNPVREQFPRRDSDRRQRLWAGVKHFVPSEKTVTAPCRRPTGQSFLNTEPGARAQSCTSCSTDTLLWGASSGVAVCVSAHDWRLDWDMFVAAFARRRSGFCVHLRDGSEPTQPRPFSVFAFNYDVFVWLPRF